MASFGKYMSVNTLPHFAALIAAHGPFDPEVKVKIALTMDGRYTIDGENAYDENGKLKFGLDLSKFINNTINGVYCTSNGLVVVDAEARSNAFYISDAGGSFLPYSVITTFKDVPGNFYVYGLELPSDHPFLQAFITL